MDEINNYFDHDYPYGDLHELNLDWVIDMSKHAADVVEGVDGRVTGLEGRMDTAEGEIDTINGLLETEEDEIDGLQASLAPAFSTESTYAVGDRVLYNYVLWQCDVAVETAGEWDGYYWHRVTVDELVHDLEIGKQDVLTFDQTPTEDSVNPVTSGGVYDALAEKVDKVVGKGLSTNDYTDADKALVLAIPQMQEDIDALKDWTSADSKTVTGNPIMLEDAANRNAEGLSVTVDPIQDLHGYDKPWAGGAGKNKLPLVLADIKSANTVGTWSGNTYTINGVSFTVFTDSAENVIGVDVDGTASSSENALFYANAITDVADLNPEGMIFNGWINGNAGSDFQSIAFFNSYGTYVSEQRQITTEITIDLDSNPKWCIISAVIRGHTVSHKKWYPMIRLSTETDPTFAPYSNTCPISGSTGTTVSTRNEDSTETASATITFGQTVYGGQVDFKTGRVRVINYGKTLTSADFISAFNAADGRRIATVATGAKTVTSNTEKGNVLCSVAITVNANDQYNGTHKTSIAINVAGQVILSFEGITTDADFRDKLDQLTPQIVYELATPIELQLTPAQLELLKGYNYVTSDGVTISLTYQPDNLLADAKNYTDAVASGLNTRIDVLESVIPDAPTTDGTYVLTCTVASVEASYRWEAQS